jgi:hypothetical protein
MYVFCNINIKRISFCHRLASPDNEFGASSYAERSLMTMTEYENRRRQLGEQMQQYKNAQSQMQGVTRIIEEVIAVIDILQLVVLTQVEYWLREVTEVVEEAERAITTTRTSEQADRLLHKLTPYDRQKQEVDKKLKQAEQQAHSLHCKQYVCVLINIFTYL